MQIKIESSPILYPQAVSIMEGKVADIISASGKEMLWFLEHPPVYTSGTSANAGDYIASQHPIYKNFPIYKTGRGGQFTYHGPGQRVVYIMADLCRYFGKDLRRYVKELENLVINSLAKFSIQATRKQGRIGIWVDGSNYKAGQAKIASIGIRVKKWVAYHGISINLNPDLTHFNGIIPCGISQYDVTSINQIKPDVTMDMLDKVLIEEFTELFSLGRNC